MNEISSVRPLDSHLTKICSRCRNIKPIDQFVFISKKNNKRAYSCLSCKRLLSKESYQRNKENVRASTAKRRAEYINTYREWRSTLKCSICPEQESCCIDLHHLDPNEKDFNISSASHCRSWETIQREIDKCIAVCRNCHSKIHAGLINISTIQRAKDNFSSPSTGV